MSIPWSLSDIPHYVPISSIFVNVLYGIDNVLNTLFCYWEVPYNNILGGDLYELSEKSIFAFVLEKIQNNSDKVISFRLGPKHMVLINDHALTKKILVNTTTERGDNYVRLTEFFGQGIFTSRIYDRWRHQRDIILHLFSTKSLCGSESAIWNKTIQIIENNKDEIIDLPRFLSKVGLVFFFALLLGIDGTDMCGSTNFNITDTQWTLSEDIDGTLNYINGALEPIQNIFSSRYHTFTYHRDRVHLWMREVIHRVRVSSHSNIIDSDELINEFLHGEKITDEMIELMISVVLGGHETTARLMLGIAYSLLLNSTIVDKIRIEPCIGYDGSSYISQVVNEGLRLFPPVWLVSRENPNPISYDDIIIQGGTSILISPLILQRKEDVWGDDAEVFYPERFLESDVKPQFFPFILGNEACPAKHFARLEAAVVIQALFQNYDLEIIGDHIPQPYSMGTFRLTR